MNNKLFCPKSLLWRLLTVLIIVSLLLPFHPQPARAAPLGANIPPGHSDRILRLKFVEGTDTGDLQLLLPAEAWALIQKINPLFTLPKSLLKELKLKGDERLKKEKGETALPLPDLGLWYELLLVQGTDMEAALALLQALPAVEYAGPAPVPSAAPSGNFKSLQGYLGAATAGVEAEYAWTVAGGTGAGITIYDVEHGWIEDHEDLSKANDYPMLLAPGDSATEDENHHGTAVLGEMVADDNGFGVTGIAYGAAVKLAPAYTANLGWNVSNAILLSAADGKPGDVILIEQQTVVCGLGLDGPSEWETPVFQAIQTATALGLVVVEAAGNGGVNLDQSACSNKFSRSTRDSGAIITGAGGPSTSSYDRQREVWSSWASSYGSRVDMQGWGSGVMTTGFGDYPDPYAWLENPVTYTNTFQGTSSASPMVAAAAAIIQAVAIQHNGAPLSPWQVRDLLVATGSPQQGNTAEHIGPRPNLKQAIANLPQSDTTLTVNILADQNDGTCSVSDCSLSEAIAAANADQTPNTIELSAGATYTLTLIDNTDATYGANGLPVVSSPITINAKGAVIKRSNASGTPEFRLFQVGSGGTLTLYQATLRNGKLAGNPGGAVLNLGKTTIDSCTLAGNSAADGGALSNQGPYNMIFNSTLTGNSASSSGGAIKSSGALSVLSSTLAYNTATTGSSLALSGTAVVKNTILVKGSSSANCASALASDSSSPSNLADDLSCGDSAVFKTVAQINLGSLASNGGRTQTMALLSGSAAIDAGNATACKVLKTKNADQRYYDRFYDGSGDQVKECDIGAYEYGSSALGSGAPAPDTTPPQAGFLFTPDKPDGLNGWYRSAPLVRVRARDTGSGVIEVRCALDPPVPPMLYTDLPEAHCPYLSADGIPVSADGPHTLYAAAMDLEGNTGLPVSASWQQDVTPPVLTCPQAGPFLLHSGEHLIGPAGVDASASGLDEAAGTLSGSVTTETIGPKSLTFTAFDLAGNSASQTCTYNVIYDFGGFYPPVSPAPALNSAEASSAIPLKFSLAGFQGLDIFAPGFPAAQPVACDTHLPSGPASATKPAGQSGLSYDPLTGWYIYVWKTVKTLAGTCQALTIQLIDGTQHVVYFRFQ